MAFIPKEGCIFFGRLSKHSYPLCLQSLFLWQYSNQAVLLLPPTSKEKRKKEKKKNKTYTKTNIQGIKESLLQRNEICRQLSYSKYKIVL